MSFNLATNDTILIVWISFDRWSLIRIPTTEHQMPDFTDFQVILP